MNNSNVGLNKNIYTGDNMNKETYDVFLTKANGNSEVAKVSADLKKYHSAVNRYYYSAYQKMLYILYAESVFNQYDPERPHNDVFHAFAKLAGERYRGLLGFNGMGSIMYYHKIRNLRKEADYSAVLINEGNYRTEFFDYYKEFVGHIDKIIIEVGRQVK